MPLARRKRMDGEDSVIEPAPSESDSSKAGMRTLISESVEERLRRVEEGLASLQDTHQLEDRLVERVSQRIRQTAARTSDLIVAAPPPPRALLPAASGQSYNQNRWFLYELVSDFRVMCKLYTDRQYRSSWLAKVTPLAAIGLIVLSWLFLSGWWVIGPWLDRLFTFIVAFVAFKILMREVVHYRETMGETPLRRAA